MAETTSLKPGARAVGRKRWPTSSLVLMVGGVLLIGLGLYFILFTSDPLDTLPRLSAWLSHVFWVLGSYIVTTGTFTCFTAATTYRRRTGRVAWLVAATGVTSIGFMVIINFAIDSDFKWVLASFTLPWVVSLWLYYRERPITALTP